MDNANTPASAPVAHATTAAHSNLNSFLLALERFSIVALTLAPAIAAPFIRNPQSQAILAAETPIAAALAQSLSISMDAGQTPGAQ